jgi:ribosomal protein L28
MAKQCAICKKGSVMVWNRKKLRGRYNPTTKTRKYPNLQWLKVPDNIDKPAYKQFRGKRVLACAKCIKAMGKIK